MEPYCNASASNNRYHRSNGNQTCRPCDMPGSANRTRNMQNAGNNSCGMQKSECSPCNMSDSMMSQRTSRNNNQRGIEMDCACRVNSRQSCHTNDPMDQLGCRFPVVMSYVPWQQWGELYEQDCALMQGTVFKDLNKIFCGVRC